MFIQEKAHVGESVTIWCKHQRSQTSEPALYKEVMKAIVHEELATMQSDLEMFEIRAVLREELVDSVIQILSSLSLLGNKRSVRPRPSFVEHEPSKLGKLPELRGNAASVRVAFFIDEFERAYGVIKGAVAITRRALIPIDIYLDSRELWAVRAEYRKYPGENTQLSLSLPTEADEGRHATYS